VKSKIGKRDSWGGRTTLIGNGDVRVSTLRDERFYLIDRNSGFEVPAFDSSQVVAIRFCESQGDVKLATVDRVVPLDFDIVSSGAVEGGDQTF
jgi:hypothetical protein